MPTGDDALEKLRVAFEIDEKVMKFFKEDLKLATVEDLGAMFVNEDEVKTVVERIEELELIPLQVSRVRQAWKSINDARVKAVLLQREELEAEHDSNLVGTLTLDVFRDRFWENYHMKYHPSVEPSDALLSKCIRRIKRRQIGVEDLWNIVPAQSQQEAEPQEQPIPGTDLVLQMGKPRDEGDEASHSVKDVTGYLQRMYIYAIALAQAGCNEAPYWNAPLEAVMNYYNRASQKVSLMLEKVDRQTTLEWLMERDLNDRTRWDDELQGSCMSLGEVIQAVTTQREATWDIPESIRHERPDEGDVERYSNREPYCSIYK